MRENRIAVVDFLLKHGADPLSLAVNDSLLDICRDRGYAEMAQVARGELCQHVQNASPAGEAVAAAIREHDLDEMQIVCWMRRPSCCMWATRDRISRSIGRR